MPYKAWHIIGLSKKKKASFFCPAVVMKAKQPRPEISSILFTSPTQIHTHPPNTHTRARTHHSSKLTFRGCFLLLPHHCLLPRSTWSPCQPWPATLPKLQPPRSPLPGPCLPTVLGSEQMCSSLPSSLMLPFPANLRPRLAAGIAILLVYNAL